MQYWFIAAYTEHCRFETRLIWHTMCIKEIKPHLSILILYK